MADKEKNPMEIEKEIKLIEAKTKTAKEQVSRMVGKWGMPALIIMVAMGIGSSILLPPESLSAVIGLVSTVTMATISMLQGITGTKDDKEDKQSNIMEKMLDNQQAAGQAPMEVSVDGGGVSIQAGNTKLTTKGDNKLAK